MNTWFTSDHHFGHANIIKYCGRPFASVSEMDQELIRRWNAVVAPEDTVYHLGDFSFHSAPASAHILSLLHGSKHLIRGNHDRSPGAMLKMGFTTVQDAMPYGKLLLVHRPEDGHHEGYDVVLCGHVHEKWAHREMQGRTFHNVGVDQHAFAPVTLYKLIGDLDVPTL